MYCMYLTLFKNTNFKKEDNVYKPLETTKQEIIDAIEEMSEITGRVYLDRSKINRHIGKLQTLAKYLPHN